MKDADLIGFFLECIDGDTAKLVRFLKLLSEFLERANSTLLERLHQADERIRELEGE